MFFEKKKSVKFSETEAFTNLFTLLPILIIAIVVLYVTNPFPKGFWDIKLIDIINAVAQIATAGAFLLALFQYKKKHRFC